MKESNNNAILNSMISSEDMDRAYGALMVAAAKSAGVDASLAQDIKQEVLLDFFVRRPGKYNFEKGTLDQFLWMVAKHKALDLQRKPHAKKVDYYDGADFEKTLEDDKSFSSVSDFYHPEDTKLLLCEALRRLYVNGASETQLKVLAMYTLQDNDRETVARRARVSADYVSLVKNRLYGKFQRHLKNIEREDLEGHLHLTNKSIDFLRPILPFV